MIDIYIITGESWNSFYRIIKSYYNKFTKKTKLKIRKYLLLIVAWLSVIYFLIFPVISSIFSNIWTNILDSAKERRYDSWIGITNEEKDRAESFCKIWNFFNKSAKSMLCLWRVSTVNSEQEDLYRQILNLDLTNEQEIEARLGLSWIYYNKNNIDNVNRELTYLSKIDGVKNDSDIMRSVFILSAFLNSDEGEKEMALSMIEKAEEVADTIYKKNEVSLAKSIILNHFWDNKEALSEVYRTKYVVWLSNDNLISAFDDLEDKIKKELSFTEIDMILKKSDSNFLSDMILDIRSNWYLEWNKDAKIIVLEYAELLCPYSRRQSTQGTIKAVLERYPNDVSYSFRNFIVHSDATKLAEWLLCVGEQWWTEKYNETISEVFRLDIKDLDNMSILIKEIGLDSDEWGECVKSSKYNSVVDDQTNEGRSLFGVTGTPWNVVINTENSKFTLIPWAYPEEKFIEEISKLLK